jgi:hypothetical protein
LQGNLLARQLACKATCLQGNLLARQLACKATCFHDNLLSLLSKLTFEASLEATRLQGNSLARQLAYEATHLRGNSLARQLMRQLAFKATIFKTIVFLTVLIMLQDECDKQASRVFAEFRRKRCVRDKVDKVKDSLNSSAAMSSSSTMTGSFSSVNSTATESSQNNPANKLEARELDHILEEMTLLQARSEMYFKFLRKKSSADIEASNEMDKDGKKKLMERRLLTCGLSQSVQELLSEYILLEDFYMTQNIRKASEQHNRYVSICSKRSRNNSFCTHATSRSNVSNNQ